MTCQTNECNGLAQQKKNRDGQYAREDYQKYKTQLFLFF